MHKLSGVTSHNRQTNKAKKPTKTVSSRRQISTLKKTGTNVNNKKTSSFLSTKTSARFFAKKKNASDSDSSEDSQDSSEEKANLDNDGVEATRKGPMMPELYVLSLQLASKRKSFYKDKHNRENYLSTISQRMLDKNGLFLRTSPPLLNVVPEYYASKHLSNRVLYFSKGDVEVFMGCISQPDDIGQNHDMVDTLLDSFDFDNVVIPLSAKPDSFKPYNNPFQRMTHADIKYDIFDPEGSPKPPQIVSGGYTAVETAQYAAYKAYDRDLDITLSGRLEFVSLNNWKFKQTQIEPFKTDAMHSVIGKNATNQELLSRTPLTILPHTSPISIVTEITLNFEPALLATAAIRSSVEEQQASYTAEIAEYKKKLETAVTEDEKKALQKPKTKRIMALMDTAQLRHFENTYDLMPSLKSTDFTYLKRGFEEWSREMSVPTLGELLAQHASATALSQAGIDSDSESSLSETTDANKKHKKSQKSLGYVAEPEIVADATLQKERMLRYHYLTQNDKTIPAPMLPIHRLYTAIYGPLASPDANTCGQCQFESDQFGLYVSRCKSPTLLFKLGLTKKQNCSDPFDWHFNPEALRFPPFDSDPLLDESISQNLFSEWMALRHSLVDYEQDIKTRTGNPTESIYLDDIMKIRDNIGKITKGNYTRTLSQHIKESHEEKHARQKANHTFLKSADPYNTKSDSDSSEDSSSSSSDDESNDKKKENFKKKLAKKEEKILQLEREIEQAKGSVSQGKPVEATTVEPVAAKKVDEENVDEKSVDEKKAEETKPQVFSQEFPVAMTTTPVEQHKQSKYNDFRKVTDALPHNIPEDQSKDGKK
jgi:hypothetical protein